MTMMSNTTDPAERLRALAYFVAHECPPDQVEQAIQEQGELILAAAYQRGWDEALDRIRNIWATRHARPEWTADMTNTLDDQADR